MSRHTLGLRFARRTALVAWCALATACATRGPSGIECRTVAAENRAAAPQSPHAGAEDFADQKELFVLRAQALDFLLKYAAVLDSPSETEWCALYFDPNARPVRETIDRRATLAGIDELTRQVGEFRARLRDEAQLQEFDAEVTEPLAAVRRRVHDAAESSYGR